VTGPRYSVGGELICRVASQDSMLAAFTLSKRSAGSERTAGVTLRRTSLATSRTPRRATFVLAEGAWLRYGNSAAWDAAGLARADPPRAA
jgi:hypothetical protein